MNQIITTETVKEITHGLKGFEDLATKGTTVLMDETIKLYIFYGVVGILKAAVVFIVFGIVFKFLNTLDKANEKPSPKIKAFKTTSLVLSLIYFTAFSYPHVLDIGKALVAPNLFLAEKGIQLVKDNK